MILHSNVFFRNNLDLNPAPKLRLKPDPSLAKIHNTAYTYCVNIYSLTKPVPVPFSIFILPYLPAFFHFFFLFSYSLFSFLIVPLYGDFPSDIFFCSYISWNSPSQYILSNTPPLTIHIFGSPITIVFIQYMSHIQYVFCGYKFRKYEFNGSFQCGITNLKLGYLAPCVIQYPHMKVSGLYI